MPGGALDRGILLPDELWEEVFCLLRPDVDIDPTPAHVVETQLVAEEHCQFHPLRLVCKRFNQIFNQHQRLAECLYLKGTSSTQPCPACCPGRLVTKARSGCS